METTLNNIGNTLEEALLQDNPNANVERSERILSIGAGAFVFIKGIGNLFSHPLLALGELALGGGLVYRGVTGYCPVKAAKNSEIDAIIEETTVVIE